MPEPKKIWMVKGHQYFNTISPELLFFAYDVHRAPEYTKQRVALIINCLVITCVNIRSLIKLFKKHKKTTYAFETTLYEKAQRLSGCINVNGITTRDINMLTCARNLLLDTTRFKRVTNNMRHESAIKIQRAWLRYAYKPGNVGYHRVKLDFDNCVKLYFNK